MGETMNNNTAKLSAFQKRILDVMPSVKRTAGHGRMPTNIHAALGQTHPTNAQRASLSRALRRLNERGLVELYGARCHLSGKGHYVVLPGELDTIMAESGALR